MNMYQVELAFDSIYELPDSHFVCGCGSTRCAELHHVERPSEAAFEAARLFISQCGHQLDLMPSEVEASPDNGIALTYGVHPWKNVLIELGNTAHPDNQCLAFRHNFSAFSKYYCFDRDEPDWVTYVLDLIETNTKED